MLCVISRTHKLNHGSHLAQITNAIHTTGQFTGVARLSQSFSWTEHVQLIRLARIVHISRSFVERV